ncbi:MAG: extracellular solute-binding protein [Opitutaceae bacterium]|nr:extracellular solute-binding protein [Opitutaceae bacterium]
MKNRIGLVLVLLAVATAFWFSWVQRGSIEAEPGVLTLRIGHFTTDPQFIGFLDQAGAEYERLNPGVRVRQMAIPRQMYLQWLRTQLVGETAPEIMQFAYFMPGVEEMVMHQFTVLNTWVNQPNPYRSHETGNLAWKDTFLDGLNSRDAYNEKLRAYFGIPLIMGGYSFFYNETMRAGLGIKPPPWSYRDFCEVAGVLERANEMTKVGGAVVPIVGSEQSSYALFKMLFSSVTQSLLLDLDSNFDLRVSHEEAATGYFLGRWNYQNTEVQRGLQLIREGSRLMNNGFSQIQKQDGVARFLQGRGLALAGSQTDLTFFRGAATFEVGETSFPLPDESDPTYGRYVLGPVNERSGSSTLTLGVLRSPQQRRAVDFLQFLTGSAMTELLKQETQWRVSVKSDSGEDMSRLISGYPKTLFDVLNAQGSEQAFHKNRYQLFKIDGGVSVFAKTMDEESPEGFRTWLDRQRSTLGETIRQQDAVIVSDIMMSDALDGKTDTRLMDFLDLNNRQEAQYLRLTREVEKIRQ